MAKDNANKVMPIAANASAATPSSGVGWQAVKVVRSATGKVAAAAPNASHRHVLVSTVAMACGTPIVCEESAQTYGLRTMCAAPKHARLMVDVVDEVASLVEVEMANAALR